MARHRSLFLCSHRFRRLLLALVLLTLLGIAQPAAVQANALTPLIQSTGKQLTVNGSPFEIRGMNYLGLPGSSRFCQETFFAPHHECPWDIRAIGRDLDHLKALGINTVRVFLNYYIFGGMRIIDPDYSPELPLSRLVAFVDAANQRGIYVLPVLLVHYPQDHFDPEHYASALELHVRPVVKRLAWHSGVLGWDLFNEPDVASAVDPRCWDWANSDAPTCLRIANARLRFLTMLHYEVKWIDPQRLTTIGMAFAKSYFKPAQAELQMAYLVDFYSFHYYDNEQFECGCYATHWYYGQGFPGDLQRAISELSALPIARPIVITETGFSQGEGSLRSREDARRDLRTVFQITRDSGLSGLMIWPVQSRPAELLGDLFFRS